MTLFYNLGIHLYSLAARTVALRSPKVKKMIAGQRNAYPYLEERSSELEGCVWIHAASLGEFEQGRPLIERLRRNHPEKKILLTFFSPSGYEVRKNFDKVDAVAYLPFDTPSRVRRFLDLVKPSLAIFVKYEFWGNYLQELDRRGIPTYIISAIFRPKQIFFRPWGKEFRKMLTRFTHLYLQDERSKALLEGVGVTNVSVVGDTRFDRVTDILNSATADLAGVERIRTGSEMTLVVGSSWEADEDRYIDWINSHNVSAIIAPHEFDDARLQKLVDAFNGRAMLFSQWRKQGAELSDADLPKVIIVDCFGLLSQLYRCADVAYIGGGYGAGIHNINEAAVYGIPVVFGPNHRKFKEAADLIAQGGGFSVSDKATTEAILDQFLADAERRRAAGAIAGDYIRRSLGATDRIYADLFN